MPTALRALAAALLAGVGLVPAAMATSAAPTRLTAGTPTLTVVKNSRYGRILFDGHRRVLYAFTRDPRGRSVCAGACAAKWPPYIVRGRVTAGAGVDASLLGTTRRADGSHQVVYAGRPLYYYVGDGPGQVLCGNVSEFGGLWLVIAPSGRTVK